MKIGILAIQGDFQAHADVLQKMEVPYTLVSSPRHLEDIQGLILPGGESSTLLKFLMEDDFLQAIQSFAMNNRYLLGTCAGAILLANEVKNPIQPSLGLLDITIERNAYGRQLASHIVRGDYLEQQNNLEMVFIRAPKISRVGNQVTILATYQGLPVGVMNNHCMATTFHPELTRETTIHQFFIDQITARA